MLSSRCCCVLSCLLGLLIVAPASAQRARGRRAAPPPATAPAATLPADPDDLTVWPNKTCNRASEPWLVENHDNIRKMRPRVLVLNFANDVEMPDIAKKTEKLVAAFAEATRYHGFEDPKAPPFLEYQVAKYVDMRDRTPAPGREHGNSAFFPAKPDGPKDFYCDYTQFYTDQYARFYGYVDPKNPRRYLNLHELIDRGVIHELWFYAIHEYAVGWPAFEVIELKQYYDKDLKSIKDKHGEAGNGHDDSFPWSGRTFRMAFFNPHRGTGCQMENYGHGLEGYSNHEPIGYLTPYMREFCELDLNKRFNVPFKSFYEVPYDKREVIKYPTQTKAELTLDGKDYTLEPYVNAGGNAHFPPGGRHQYDLESPFTVMSRLENYRMRNGSDGKDKTEPFNKEKFARYKDVAPDCMGPWLVYWRQCMPGLDNKALDDDGKPMKNWWVFLFY